jgi:transaldolase
MIPSVTGPGGVHGPATGPLRAMVDTTPTELWNDSCGEAELRDALLRGATGATSNPTLVLDVLRSESETWRPRIRELAAEHAAAGEQEIAWLLAEEIAVRGAGLLAPTFERTGRRAGRLSIQVSPALYRDADGMVRQAVRFAGLAPNLQVKLPVTTAGLVAIEEATALGIHINATVNFTVAGAIAVAEAVERGLGRAQAAGIDPAGLQPVCTIMAGRLEDWLHAVAAREGRLPTPGTVEWSGVAVVKRAYRLYRERGYRTRLLAGAFRNHLPWSALVGGDLILTIPPAWQRRLDASGLPARPAMDEPVPDAPLGELMAMFPEFHRAYEPDGLAPGELETYGAAVRTLRAFHVAYHDLQAQVRDVLLPDPDQ